MRFLTAGILATASIVFVSSPAAAQTTTLTATFSRGAIAEYANGANGTSNAALFSSLGITSMTISQQSATGSWGGTQGNDTSVTAKITFTNGSSTTFPAAINWVKNAGQGSFDYIGLTIDEAQAVTDGYNLTFGLEKTYILQFAQSSLDLASLLPNDLDGSANAGNALGALNLYFPTAVAAPPVITGPGGTAISAVSVNESQTGVTTLSSNKAGTTWAISGGTDGALFAISPTGVITFLTAPDWGAPNDSNGDNVYVLEVQATDPNGGVTTQSLAVTVLNLDENAPTVTANQSFDYAENRAANDPIGTVAATDSVGVTAFRFAATGNQTSADGYFAIDNTGLIRITAAGAAAGVASNDFETGPNSFSYDVQAGDLAGNWSAAVSVGLNVTDVNEVTNAPPAITAGQVFTYPENSSASAIIGTVAASDDNGLTAFRFTASGGQTTSDGYFAIDAGGVVRLTAAGAAAGISSNDFEIAPNSFTYGVEAGDGGGLWSPSTNVTFQLADLDDTAPAIAAGQSFTYVENRSAGNIVGTVAGSDAVGVTAFRFAATASQTSADGFYTIDDGGVLRITAAGVAAGVANNDFEIAPNSFSYGIEAGDAAGNWSAAATIALNVTDADDTAPVIDPGQSFTYAENQAAGTLLGTVAASDDGGVTGFRFAATGTSTSADGFFAVDASGRLTLTAAGAAAGVASNDFETAPNSFTLALQARDAAGNWSASTDFTLDVTDLDDTGPVVAATQVFSYAENRGAGDLLGTVAASDNAAVAGFRFAASGSAISPDGFFAIDAAGRLTLTAAGRAAGAATNDYEVAPNSFTYAVQARDPSGNWSDPATIVLNLTDVDDTAPVIAAGQAFSYAENQAANALVGTVAASDNVSVASFRFAATGTQTSADGFYVIDNAGNIRITAAGAAAGTASNDFEIAPNSFDHAVEARDAAGNRSAPASVNLKVTNLADNPPVITGPGGATGSAVAISIPENQTAVGQLTSSVAGTSWTITSGDDRSRFSIDAQGRLVFNRAPDFDAPEDSDSNNIYVLVIEATAPDGSKSTQTITVNVTNVADMPPVISGPGGSSGATATISVPENQAAVSELTSSVPGTTWAITAGDDRGRFSIDPQGRLVFTRAPDFDAPSDADTNNSYVLVVEATAPDGSKSTQGITVNVTNVADMPPVITGPGGSTGASASIIIPENQTLVSQLASSVAGTSWSVVSGDDRGRFSVDAQGRLLFNQAPDFDAPGDADKNNSYVLVIEAKAPDGSKTSQAITVTVTDVQDTPPVITGPSGGPGALASAIAVKEGTTSVTTLAAGVPVTWSIVGGNDRARFALSPGGALTFVSAPDYEAPSDSDRNNSYVLIVEARDAFGNVSTQTITVNVVNVEELQHRLNEIGGKLRGNLRSQAFSSLSTMLSFNEGLLGLDNGCAGAGAKRISGGANASESRQDATINYRRDLSSCEARTRVLTDGGLGFSRVDDRWSARGLASFRVERKVGASTTLGAAVIGTASDDALSSFADSNISDRSLQLNVYGRTHLSETLRFAAFAGLGRSWYEFRLADRGLTLTGEMDGNRHLYGAALSGDIDLGGLRLTTDAILSRAVEKLGHATLAGSLGGEESSDILFRLGRVDITRLSVPVHLPIVFSRPNDGREAMRLDISPGLLCQDTAQDSSSLDCGYQLGLKFRLAPSLHSLFRAEARAEAADGYLLSNFTVSYQNRFGSGGRFAWGVDASRQARARLADNRLLLRVGLGY